MERVEERKDPIVEEVRPAREVRRAREAHAEKFGKDLRAIVRDYKKHERQHDREVVSFAPKRLAQTERAA